MTDDSEAREFFERLDLQRRDAQDLFDKYVPRYESGDRDFFKGSERAVWRCRKRGCLLLLVWDAPEGAIWFRPAYKLSRGLNLESSNPAGRANNTADGDRHWKANLAPFDQVRSYAAEGGISLECDHVHRYTTRDELVGAVDSSRPGIPSTVIL